MPVCVGVRAPIEHSASRRATPKTLDIVQALVKLPQNGCACLGVHVCVCVCVRSAINPETMDEDILMYSAQLKHKENYAQLIRSLSLSSSSLPSLSCSRSLSLCIHFKS